MAQIGTIRVDTQNNGTVSIPVFDTGDSGSSVYEFVRVQTATGTGFIPLVDPPEAQFPYLRVQSQNNGVVAVHNESNLLVSSDTVFVYDSSGSMPDSTTSDAENDANNIMNELQALDSNIFRFGYAEYTDTVKNTVNLTQNPNDITSAYPDDTSGGTTQSEGIDAADNILTNAVDIIILQADLGSTAATDFRQARDNNFLITVAYDESISGYASVDENGTRDLTEFGTGEAGSLPATEIADTIANARFENYSP